MRAWSPHTHFFHTGTETYTIEWSSRQLFRNGHVIDLSTIDALGLGAGRDAPDVMHVIRADPSKRPKLRNYFWVRYVQSDGRKKIRCFFAEESAIAKVWITVLQELQGSTTDRQRRKEKRSSYECTSKNCIVRIYIYFSTLEQQQQHRYIRDDTSRGSHIS